MTQLLQQLSGSDGFLRLPGEWCTSLSLPRSSHLLLCNSTKQMPRSRTTSRPCLLLVVGGKGIGRDRFFPVNLALQYASPRWRTARLRVTRAQEHQPVRPLQTTRGPQTATGSTTSQPSTSVSSNPCAETHIFSLALGEVVGPFHCLFNLLCIMSAPLPLLTRCRRVSIVSSAGTVAPYLAATREIAMAVDLDLDTDICNSETQIFNESSTSLPHL